MQITVFNGSPRKVNGVTHLMTERFLAGAQKASAETNYIFLEKKKIHPCLGCFACWFKTPGKCAVKDDMQELLDLYMRSDIIVFAGPVYVGSVTGIMKNFIDRMLPIFDPRTQKDNDGHYYHLPRYEKYPDVFLISNGGFPDQAHFEYYRSIFDFMKIVYNMNIIGEVFLGGGFLLQGFVPDMENKVEQYLQLLHKSGEEIVQNQRLSNELILELKKPLIPIDQAVDQGNQVFEALIDAMNET